MKALLNSLLVGFLVCLPLLFTPSTADSQVSVLTHRNDPGRTGQNLNETILNTGNVKVATFGKLFARAVDGQIYAQPLYVPNLVVQGVTRNVVYVATEHNSVYAFDADDPNVKLPLWQVNLGPSVPNNDVCLNSTAEDCPNVDTFPEYGITATPVIDPGSNTIYVVAKTKTSSAYHYKLHALDIVSGIEKFGGPVEISGQVNGTASDSVNGKVIFTPLQEGNRPGLLLMNGVVYTAFGSVGEIPPWHGWVLGYSASTLQQVALFNVTPDGEFGGLWGGGQGLLGEAGNVYVMSGNGTFDANVSGRDYGNSIIKLSTTSGLTVADYFTPFNQDFLNSIDLDLGSGAPMALPGTGFIVAAGKDGVLRLLNTANMGQYHATFNNDVQEFQATPGIFMGAPIYWNSPNNGPVIYLWGPADFLKAFKFSGGLFQTTPVSQSTMKGIAGYSNAVPLSLSANGSQLGTGIVWGWAPFGGDANHATVSGMLRAFDATNLSQELWNSEQFPARDSAGNYAKFSIPTVANGKVYLATFSGQLLVYGLNPPTVSPLPAPWASQDIGNVGVTGTASFANGAFTVNGSGVDIEDNADSFRFVYQPLNGDGQIVARVVSQQFTDPWAKAGVMIRETLNADSKHAMMVITPGNGAAFQRRLTTGGTTFHTPGPAVTAPYWVKIVRSGATFSGFVSADGVSWTPVGSDTISMTANAYIGLPVTSHNNTVSCTVTFDNVAAAASASPTVGITSPLTGSSYAAPATVAITATATASTGATVTKVEFFAGGTLIGSASTSPYGVTWNNVPAGTYSLTAQITDSLGKSATSAPVGITVASLPAPWAAQDIGNVGITGSTSFAGGTFTVKGSGIDIEDNADSFQYAYQPLNGDGQIVARVATQQNTDPWAKAGVMIRETLSAGSKQAMMVITPSNGSAFQRRLSTGGTTLHTPGPLVKAPYWVKMVRSGTTFSGFVSADGVIWVPVGSDTISMASGVFIGLAVTSHNNTLLCTATMDGVSLTGTSGSSPAIGNITPASGPTTGGTTVTITGANFVSGATVSFGGTPASNVTVAGSTGITATTAAHAAGQVDVVVTNPDGQSATLSNGFTYTTTVAIGFVQVAAATPSSATQTVTLAYPSPQKTGNLNVVVVGWNDTTSSVQSVKDSLGNAYTLAAGPIRGSNVSQSIYYAKGIVAGSNQVTVTFNQAARYPDIRILEYAGVSAADRNVGATGNSALSSSGSATTTSAKELIFAANTVVTRTTGAGSGFTSRIITSPDGDIAEDMIVDAVGTYGATAPLSAAGAWVMQLVTFK
jgi:hypothetical protein